VLKAWAESVGSKFKNAQMDLASIKNWNGTSPNNFLISFEGAKEVQRVLRASPPPYRQTPLFIKSCSRIAHILLISLISLY
jgi:hypothetical protein